MVFLAIILLFSVYVDGAITTKQEYFKKLDVAVASMSINSPVISTYSHLTLVNCFNTYKRSLNIEIWGEFKIALRFFFS